MKTVQMTAAGVATRTARFDQLQAMSTLKDNPVVPPGVCRGFRNIAATDSKLLSVITGGVHDRNDISLPPSIGKAIDAYGPGVLDEVKKIGLTFDAGLEKAEA